MAIVYAYNCSQPTDKAWRAFSYGTGALCECGSGRESLRCEDSRGNFVADFCQDCEESKLSGYNPDIWNGGYRIEDYDDEELDW
jgi:hypothetical protein